MKSFSVTLACALFVIASQAQAQPEITSGHMNIYCHIQGSGEGVPGENVSYGFELFVHVEGSNLTGIQPENISLHADGTLLTIEGLEIYIRDGDGLFLVQGNGGFDGQPELGIYTVLIKDANDQESNVFSIGKLEDYPKDAPELLFPTHRQMITETRHQRRGEVAQLF